MRATSITWVFAALSLATLPAGVADDPTQPAQEVLLCLAAQGDVNLAAAADRFAPGQLLPRPVADGGATVDVCVRNNGTVRFTSADALGEHRIVTALDGGACFDSVRAFGHAMRAGEQFRLRVHVHSLDSFTLAVENGPFVECFGATQRVDADYAVVPFGCPLHPDTMRATLLVRW